MVRVIHKELCIVSLICSDVSTLALPEGRLIVSHEFESIIAGEEVLKVRLDIHSETEYFQMFILVALFCLKAPFISHIP